MGGAIEDSQISASSLHVGFLGLQRWTPELARLHLTGIVNAWSPSSYDRKSWIQVWRGWDPRAGDEGEGEVNMAVVGLWR